MLSRSSGAAGKSVFPRIRFACQANISGMPAYLKMCDDADRDFEGFWERLARAELLWQKPFTQVLNDSQAPFFKWFEDGQLNASYNCLDRHLKSQPDKTAIVFEADDGTVTRITYRALHRRVCMMANGLKSLGMRKSDRVIIYMPMSIEAVVAMQACAASARSIRWFRRLFAKSFGSASSTPARSRADRRRADPRGRTIALRFRRRTLAMGGCEGIRSGVYNAPAQGRLGRGRECGSTRS